MRQVNEITDPSANWKERRNKVLLCGYCPPNRKENVKRHSKQRAKGWKDKSKARKNYLKRSTPKGQK